MPGLKFDDDKPDMSLLSRPFLEAVAHAKMIGEKKYGRYNYLEGMEASRYVAAAMRHLVAWMDGEDFDPKDGHCHLGAVGANMDMLLHCLENGTLIDNRRTAKCKTTHLSVSMTSDEIE